MTVPPVIDESAQTSDQQRSAGDAVRRQLSSLTSAPPWQSAGAQRGSPLAEDAQTDVVVIGAGIVGLTVACSLARRGVQVRLLEDRSPGVGTTGASTAKVSALHQLGYRELVRTHGAKAATAYADANRRGLEWVIQQIEDGEDHCDLRADATP